MKKLLHWWGTDALTLVENPPTDTVLWWIKLIFYRWKWKILHRFFDRHLIVHERLRQHLLDFGIKNDKISVQIAPPLYPDKYPKKLHNGFVIMYYHPLPACLGGETYIRWKYGIDFIEQAKSAMFGLRDIHFLKIDGTKDMSKIYPVVDYMLRPSRHDGQPRMNLECDNNNIPYYYSADGWPSMFEIKGHLLINYNKWKSQDIAQAMK